MSLFKFEKNGQRILGVLGVFVAVMFILFSMGNTAWIMWTAAFFALFLGIFLWVEGGILSYFKSSQYKSIGLGDFIVWASFIVGALLIVIGISLISGIGDIVPSVWSSWLTGSASVWIAIIAGLLFVYHAFAKRPS